MLLSNEITRLQNAAVNRGWDREPRSGPVQRQSVAVYGRGPPYLPLDSNPGLRGRFKVTGKPQSRPAPPLGHFPEGRAFQTPGESRPSGK